MRKIVPSSQELEQLMTFVKDAFYRTDDDPRFNVLQANLRSLLENTDAFILFSDYRGMPVYFNSNYARIMKEALGIDMKMGLQPHQMLPEPWRRWWDELHRRVLSGEHFVEEYGHRFPDGRFRTFEISFNPILINDNVVGFSEYTREITDRKIAESLLRQSEEHLRSLMESAKNFAVFRLRVQRSSPAKMEVVFVSPSLQNILGAADPMDFKTWFSHVHPEDAERLAEATRKVPETSNLDETVRIIHPQKDEIRWLQMVSSGVTDPGGTLRYLNGTVIDISERKWMEEKLAERERELAFKSEKLEEVNIALRVLLKKREEDRVGLEDKIIANINELVLPHLEKAKVLVSDKKARVHLEIIDENLKEVISPFAQKLTSSSFNLTPTEIQVAHLVKHGYSTKAIAEQLTVSHKTVEVHRLNIRKKFGIARKKANLRTFLLGLK